MFIEPYLAAVVTSIKEALPTVKQCGDHPGRFNLKELQRIAAKAPAVLVSVLKVRVVINSPAKESNLFCSACTAEVTKACLL